MRPWLIALVLVLFTAFSVLVVRDQPFFGFLSMTTREPWGLQVLVDLVLALSLFMLWMFKDARERGVPAWPYVPLILLLGSIGALSYLLHRELAGRRATAALA